MRTESRLFSYKGGEKNPSPAPVADRGNPHRGLGAPLQFPFSNSSAPEQPLHLIRPPGARHLGRTAKVSALRRRFFLRALPAGLEGGWLWHVAQ